MEDMTRAEINLKITNRIIKNGKCITKHQVACKSIEPKVVQKGETARGKSGATIAGGDAIA